MANPKIPTEASVSKALEPYQGYAAFSVAPILSDSEYEKYAEELRDVKRRLGEVDDLRKTMTKPLDQAKAAIQGMFKPVMSQYETRESGLKRAMADFLLEKRRQAAELEAKLRDEQRLLAQRAEARAEKLRTQGKDEQAAVALLNIPPVPIVAPDNPKATGISTRTNWRVSIDNFADLVQYALDTADFDVLLPDESELASRARTQKGLLNIPGIKVYEDTSVVARRW